MFKLQIGASVLPIKVRCCGGDTKNFSSLCVGHAQKKTKFHNSRLTITMLPPFLQGVIQFKNVDLLVPQMSLKSVHFRKWLSHDISTPGNAYDSYFENNN